MSVLEINLSYFKQTKYFLKVLALIIFDCSVLRLRILRYFLRK